MEDWKFPENVKKKKTTQRKSFTFPGGKFSKSYKEKEKITDDDKVCSHFLSHTS